MDYLYFYSIPHFTSFTTYCNSHFQHHRNLWDEENDPDTKRYRIVGLDKPQENINKFIKDHIIKVLLLFHVPKYILGTVSANLYSKDIPKSELWTRNILWLVLISTSIVFNFDFTLLSFGLYHFLQLFKLFVTGQKWQNIQD